MVTRQRERAFWGPEAPGPADSEDAPARRERTRGMSATAGPHPAASKWVAHAQDPERAPEGRGLGRKRTSKFWRLSLCARDLWRPDGAMGASASWGLCRADALPACEQGLFSLHALGLRSSEELPSVGAWGICIPGLHLARVTVGLGNVPAA